MPPTQASTCSQRPNSSAIAPISATGSTSPSEYEGAEAYIATLFGVMAASIADGSARWSGPWGTRIAFMPSMCAALLKAGCAEYAATISG